MAAAVASPTGASNAKKTILHIEDNPSHRKLFETMLATRPEFKVLTAPDGDLALELARRHRFDLIVLDLWLVGMQGDEVLRRLKNDRRTRHTPVVVVTADATADKAGLLHSGAAAQLEKPFDIDKLLEAVDEALVLTNRRTWRAKM